jgi:hypothetical protein
MWIRIDILPHIDARRQGRGQAYERLHAALSEERSSLDRAEERRRCAQVARLSAHGIGKKEMKRKRYLD